MCRRDSKHDRSVKFCGFLWVDDLVDCSFPVERPTKNTKGTCFRCSVFLFEFDHYSIGVLCVIDCILYLFNSSFLYCLIAVNRKNPIIGCFAFCVVASFGKVIAPFKEYNTSVFVCYLDSIISRSRIAHNYLIDSFNGLKHCFDHCFFVFCYNDC
jgi:hypothetical protein